MKKPNKYYNDFRIYEDRDSWMRNWHSRIVKTRKTHHCYNCNTDIPKGLEALLETAIDPDSGRVSSYTCAKCVDQYVKVLSDGGEITIAFDYEGKAGKHE